MNFFQAIQRPSRFVNYNRTTEEFYKEELKWIEKEEFWFSCWDEFSGWHPDMLKEKMREVVEKKMLNLRNGNKL